MRIYKRTCWTDKTLVMQILDWGKRIWRNLEKSEESFVAKALVEQLLLRKSAPMGLALLL